VFVLVEGIPELASNDYSTRPSVFTKLDIDFPRTELFSLYKPVFDGLLNTFSGLLFITVVASTIEQTISDFDGIVNGLK
jgi:hypothetical protein